MRILALLAVSASVPCGGAGPVDTDIAHTDPVDGDSDRLDTDRAVEDTDETDRPPVEDCTNGADDDLDGLADCRDASCLNAPHCGEQDCDDGLDDDGDLVADCEDADCWRHGCGATVTVKVTTGTLSWAWDSTSRWGRCGGPITGGGHRTGPVRLLDARGWLRIESPGGGVASACSWTVDHATQTMTTSRNTSLKFFDATPGADRSGFRPGPGCPRANLEDVFPPWLLPWHNGDISAPTTVEASWGQTARLAGIPFGHRDLFGWATGSVDEVELNRQGTHTESHCYVPSGETFESCECHGGTASSNGYTRWTNLHTATPVARPLPWVP